MEDTPPPGVSGAPVARPDGAIHSGPAPQQERAQGPGRMSDKLVGMLLDLRPEQRDEVARIVGKLLAAKAHRTAKKG